MLRVSKLTDYATVVMAWLAKAPEVARNAAEIAAELRLPEPTVRKLLKSLTKAGLLHSQQGVKGGYSLALAPEEISVAQVVQALEGPIALTECSDGEAHCAQAQVCDLKSQWPGINQAIFLALAQVNLAALNQVAAREVPINFVAPVRPDGSSPVQEPFLGHEC